MMKEKIPFQVFFDGSPKGYSCIKMNGVPTVESNENILRSVGLPISIMGRTKSQRAEYIALIYLLLNVSDYDFHEVTGDCDNVILQMQGANRVKDKTLKILYDKCQEIILKNGLTLEYSHVKRDYNPAGIWLEHYIKQY